MLTREDSSCLLCLLSNNASRQHDMIMADIIQQSEYRLFPILKPSLTKDGDQWCVFYGEDLQVGICGFGETPYRAIIAFNKGFGC